VALVLIEYSALEPSFSVVLKTASYYPESAARHPGKFHRAGRLWVGLKLCG